jgi:hypothetical protein
MAVGEVGPRWKYLCVPLSGVKRLLALRAESEWVSVTGHEKWHRTPALGIGGRKK